MLKGWEKEKRIAVERQDIPALEHPLDQVRQVKGRDEG
jgi:hypothetical protein